MRLASRASSRIVLLALVLTAGPASAGTLQGTVTNQLTSAAVGGVLVRVDPGASETTTSAGGTYALPLAAGTYTVSFTDERFQTRSESVTVPDVGSEALDVELTPVAPVIVSADVTGDPAPDAVLSATATITILDGSTLLGIQWTQSAGGAVAFGDPTLATTSVTLPGESAYKDELVRVLTESPIGPDDLPPNVELPSGGFSGGLQDRFQVVAVNPFALENAAAATLQVAVTTSSGVYTDGIEVDAALPWKSAGGLRNVPLGHPVLLNGRNPSGGGSAVYDWALARPASSSATLTDASTRNPWFVPDVAGRYTLTVTDPVSSGPVAIEVYAGPWHGVITGADPDGKPLAEDCTFCHDGAIAPDNFTPWRSTGHAAIFQQTLDTNSHNGSSCFACHAVGFDTEVANNGLDDAFDYPDFLASGLINDVPADNWSTVLHDFPDTARLASVQCESCHGPHGGSHGRGEPSITLAADNCAQCHGEPARHGRFQQWQLSKHSNYELAGERASSGDCSRCHTANGFLAWLPILLDDDPLTDPTASIAVTWTADESHPQTCVTCHDPHSTGTTSGINTDATVRISGDTPPLIAGFTATDVGRGAMCMTCHNTRRGLKNDATFDPNSSDVSRAPHPGAQSDVLMGQNAYLVGVGTRGTHSTIEDTCVTCHMEKTPPPNILSYNRQGTNHTFFPSSTICASCHLDGRVAEDVQGPVSLELAGLQSDLEGAILDLLAAQFALGRSVKLGSGSTLTSSTEIADLEFTEASGRQAITVSLTAGGSVGPIGMNAVTVYDGATNLGELYKFADSRIPKAGWNLLLVTDDSSLGVHNANFVDEVLATSRSAVQAIPEPGSLGPVLVAFATLFGRARYARSKSRPPA